MILNFRIKPHRRRVIFILFSFLISHFSFLISLFSFLFSLFSFLISHFCFHKKKKTVELNNLIKHRRHPIDLATKGKDFENLD